MSRVMRAGAARRAAVRLAGVGLIAGMVAGLAIGSTATAQAGDLAAPTYAYPQVAPDDGRAYEHAGPCRMVLERGVDPYGRAVVHRMRVCDEGTVYPGRRDAVAPQDDGYPQRGYPPQYGYPARRYYGPVPSGYDPYVARPPAPVGPGYY
jgi:hypothetical protein